jgi:EAL domain-containing protein (putative c-di-GMP-specific phosphodiesterase class I)/GGDEF domain-containing protein
VLGLLLTEVPELTRLVDLHGGHLGDRCRKQLADYLTAMVREGDTVARTGRYSFAILLTDMARTEDLVNLTERLLRGPEVRIDGETLPIRLALRGGAALFPNDGMNAETLLRHAALALHNNTAAPGTCTFYSPSLNKMAQTQLQLTHGLQHAIEREELSMVYQLLVDANTKQPQGVEALLRWNSARYGHVSPAHFIPIAEEGKIIHALGDWVLEQACMQLLTWREAGVEPGHLSVNIAAPQLLRAGFAEHLRAIMERMGVLSLAPALALEVTETAFMDDLDRAEQALHEIRALGVKVYLDDFGTGFSSLSYLNRLPVDALKIDRVFISGLPGDERAGSLVKAIIALAHSLELKVIAEGVETPEQADWLQARGCDLLQGFLYSRPVPAGELGLK